MAAREKQIVENKAIVARAKKEHAMLLEQAEKAHEALVLKVNHENKVSTQQYIEQHKNQCDIIKEEFKEQRQRYLVSASSLVDHLARLLVWLRHRSRRIFGLTFQKIAQ